MFEVLILLKHGSFIDVVVGSNPMVVRIVGEDSDVFRVVTTNVHVEEHHISVHVLLLQQMLQVFADRYDGFWQARLLVPGIDGEVKDGRAGVPQTVGNIGAQ